MMPEKPSYLHSTTSQLLVMITAAYLGGCGWMLYKGENEIGMVGLESAWQLVLVIYGVRKLGDIAKGKTG